MSAPPSTFSPGYLDEYIGFKLTWLSSAFIVINVCFVSLRYYARYVSKTSIGADDYITLLSLVCAVAISTIGISFVKYGGAGYHFMAILLRAHEKLAPFKKLTFIFANVYILSVMFPKLAMLCFFLRIFAQPWHRRACYILMGVLIATAIAAFVSNLTQCIPLEFAWDVKEDGGQCFNQKLFWTLVSLPNIITDLIMLALPVPVIWNIQLSWKDKVGLILTFAAGSIGTVTSILRFQTFIRYADPVDDPSWHSIELVMYSITEVGVYVIASCLPSYRALYLSIRRQQPIPKAGLPTRFKRYEFWHLLPWTGSMYKSEKIEAVENGLSFYPNYHQQG